MRLPDPPDPPDPIVLVTAVVGRDPDLLDRDQLASHRRDIAALAAWCDAQQVRATRAQRRLAGAGHAEHPRAALADEGGLSAKDARAADDRERVCSAFPGFEAALSAGAVSAGHVDAVANAIRRLDDTARAEFATHTDALVDAATASTVDEFDRTCRDLARLIVATAAVSGGADAEADELERQRRASKVSRFTDPETGMRHTTIVLDPIRDAQLWSAIDAARRRLRRDAGPGRVNWAQLQVDALIAAVGGDAPGDGGVVVLVDLDTLLNGLHEHGVCELSDGTALPVATVREMACRMGIIPVVLDGAGRALDVGRSHRLATEAQRMAIRAMYATCAVPGCCTPVDQCEIHHVDPWEAGGPTDLANLVPLCLVEGHHQLVHSGGWTLTIDEQRRITLVRPDGTVSFTGSTVDRAPKGVGVQRSVA